MAWRGLSLLGDRQAGDQNGKAYFAFTKLGKFFMRDGEGWVVEASNILMERDPDKLEFRLLPEGDKGIRNPALGSVQEEHNLVPLTGNDLLCVFRTANGVPAQSYSRDNGLTWSLPEPMTFAPGKRTFKTPRACPKMFVTSEGKYLFWYHHHGGKSWAGRNPAFLSGGVLNADGFIHWSEPELVLFDANVAIRMSYPDLIEHEGRFWLTETQKTVARVHPLDRALLDGLWNQTQAKEVCTNGMLLEKKDDGDAASRPTVPRGFGDLAYGGVTVEVWLNPPMRHRGKLLFSTLTEDGCGGVLRLRLGGRPTLAIELETARGQRFAHRSRRDRSREASSRRLYLRLLSCSDLSHCRWCFLRRRNTRPYGWGRLPWRWAM